MTIKLHISPCPNDTFMFDALVNGRIDTDLHLDTSYFDIEELNRHAMRAGGLGAPDHEGPDVCKVSYAALPCLIDKYTVLECGSALGHGNGPVMVRRPETDVIQRVAIPGLHTTANRLVELFYPDVTDKIPLLFSEIAPAVARGEFDAGVLIHEGRFVYEKLRLELVADLGQVWEREKHLPLPLGAIVVKRNLSDGIKRQIETDLRRSIEYAFAHPEASRSYIKSHAQEMDDSVIDSHIRLFVNEYSVALGDEGHRAVEEFTGLRIWN